MFLISQVAHVQLHERGAEGQARCVCVGGGRRSVCVGGRGAGSWTLVCMAAPPDVEGLSQVGHHAHLLGVRVCVGWGWGGGGVRGQARGRVCGKVGGEGAGVRAGGAGEEWWLISPLPQSAPGRRVPAGP